MNRLFLQKRKGCEKSLLWERAGFEMTGSSGEASENAVSERTTWPLRLGGKSDIWQRCVEPNIEVLTGEEKAIPVRQLQELNKTVDQQSGLPFGTCLKSRIS